MPQILRHQPTGWQTANFLNESRKFGPYIATVCQAWSELEWSLSLMISAVLGTTRKRDQGYSVDAPNWVAKAAIDQMISIRMRIDFLEATVGRLAKEAELTDEWQKFTKSLSKRSKERNEIVHGRWLFSDTHADDLLIEDDAGRLVCWKVHDFEQVLARIDDVRRQAYSLQIKLIDAVGSGKIPAHWLGHPQFAPDNRSIVEFLTGGGSATR